MIGGNTTVLLQVRTGYTKNEIGERIPVWKNVMELTGFLDYMSGDSRYGTYNAKIQESTHLFISDYKPIPGTLNAEGKTVKVKAENSRIMAKPELYDVVMMDDPMGLHKHWEIFLKYTGGQ